MSRDRHGRRLRSHQRPVVRAEVGHGPIHGGLKWTSENVALSTEVDYTSNPFTAATSYIYDAEYYPPTYTADFNYNGTGTPYMSDIGYRHLDNPANFPRSPALRSMELQTGDEVDWRADLGLP